MAQNTFDSSLDRVSKIAGILLPLVIGVVGAIYTIQKDKSDESARVSQAQYANFSALLPLILSNDDKQVSTALDIYSQEAAIGLAPPSLRPLLPQIAAAKPQLRAQAQAAEQAASVQAGAGCKEFPSGLFLQVANNVEQLKDGQALAGLLKSEAGLPPVQGVQRVDAVPQKTQLRYYFSSANDPQADRVIAVLHRLGFSAVVKQDLSPTYLKDKKCPPPPTFELWIGSVDALDERGMPNGLTKPSVP
jgi:hypothetical protein